MDQYIGKLLDNRYEIMEQIGRGGMARVFRALDHRLNRQVAVKILREDLAEDAELRRRFHEESQAVAMLSHPNIVAVYDVSRSSDVEYIVMELIDGITLKQYMQKKGNKLNWREALHLSSTCRRRGTSSTGGRPSTSSPRSSRPWATPTAGGSSTGTSSPTTSWSSGTGA